MIWRDPQLSSTYVIRCITSIQSKIATMYYRPVLKAHKVPLFDKHNGQEGCNAAINSLRPRRNGRFNADDIFKCIFLNENVWFPTKMSVKFVPKGPINNILALVQIIAWRRPGDKPLSEPMRVYWGIYVSPGLNELKWNNNGITILHYVLINSEFCNWVPSLCLWSFFCRYWYSHPFPLLLRSCSYGIENCILCLRTA